MNFSTYVQIPLLPLAIKTARPILSALSEPRFYYVSKLDAQKYAV